MPIEEYQQPHSASPPPVGLLVGMVAATALMAAALIVLYLKSVPLSLRLLLAALELLVTGLGCWAILKLRKKR